MCIRLCAFRFVHNPNDGSLVLVPSLSWSVLENFDVMCIGLFFTGDAAEYEPTAIRFYENEILLNQKDRLCSPCLLRYTNILFSIEQFCRSHCHSGESFESTKWILRNLFRRHESLEHQHFFVSTKFRAVDKNTVRWKGESR